MDYHFTSLLIEQAILQKKLHHFFCDTAFSKYDKTFSLLLFCFQCFNSFLHRHIIMKQDRIESWIA